MSEASLWLETYNKFWTTQLDAFEAYVMSKQSGEQDNDSSKESPTESGAKKDD